MRWRTCFVLLLTAAWSFFFSDGAYSQNYADRKALIVNVCPHVELWQFSFANRQAERRDRFEMWLSWTNTANQPLIAVEVVFLKYDAFDQRLIGTRWTVNGRNGSDWQPLAVGQTNRDVDISFGSEEVFTAIAYVRAVRFADGTVWRVDDTVLGDALRKVAPGIKDFGNVKPDPKQKSE